MPMGKGYGKDYKSSPSVKPKMGDYGGAFQSTPSSNAGNSGRRIESAPFSKNPKQKDSMSYKGGYRNLTGPGDYGNKG